MRRLGTPSLPSVLGLAPRVEIFVLGEEGACFVVDAIADDAEGVVFEQFGNVAAVAGGELDVGIVDGGVLHGWHF